MDMGIAASSQGWASAGHGPWHRGEWGAGALGASVLHIGLALGVALAVAVNRDQFMDRPELAIELDMGASAPPPLLEQKEGAGGGGAGGAIASPEPLKETAKPMPPVVPPEFIEPVEGAPAVRTEGPPPAGYGAGFGGGMGGGIGGGMGRGIGTGSGEGVDIKPPPPPRQAPVDAGVQYDEVSTAIYSSLIRYPQSALDNQQEGMGRLRVVVTREGKVLSWGIEQSTGHSVLDREIRRVARKVDALDPLPMLPAGTQAIVHVKIFFHIVG
ncbi:energy transducer TonB [Novosphingobium beihaiensis]|uniref:TonB family protein n=1 Tax=Novosphingobium beihaiensis TaxID=2930389 RepID=A0ABT0BSC5_9SPHN|nr:energy transducer TonB [Novosphingobium beihaiensis]MCJ2187978.1 TonB family protein [Novosphingobium beihaiensis]